MKRKFLIYGGVLVLVLAVCIGISFNKDSDKTGGGKNEKIELGSGIYITAIEPYTGSFVEDGTDEFVENLLSITIENNGSDYVQLLNVTIDGEYVFQVTTLLPGEKMLVLEQSRAAYERSIDGDDVVVSNVAFFDEEPSMHEELLKISGEDNRISVENVSGKVFPGGRVFYKNKYEDKYIGGITYAGTIPELKKGETVVLNSAHYLKDSSELMFVTYAE